MRVFPSVLFTSYLVLVAACGGSTDSSSPSNEGASGASGASGGSGVGGASGGGGGGSGAAGSPAGGGAGAAGAAGDADKACTDLVAARCERLATCVVNGITTKYGTMDQCLAREKLGCLAGLAAPQTSSTPAYVEGCAAALAAQSCADYVAQKPACEPSAGPLPAAAPCSASAQCQSVFCAVPKEAICGTCAPAPKPGDSCESIGCGRDLSCDGATKQCVSPAAEGAACDKATSCQPGLSCVGPKDKPGVCTKQVATAGAACDFKHETAPECDRDAGLFCNKNNQCQAVTVGKAGEACGLVDGVLVVCGGASDCAGQQGAKTCVPAAADGAACDTAAGPFCLSPARCIPTMAGGTAGVCTLTDPTTCK